MLHVIFGGFIGFSLLYSMFRGQEEQVISAMLAGAGEAVETAAAMAGGFAFFCGMISILRRAGAAERLGKKLARPLRWLLGPSLPPAALESACLNLTANVLGLGNAATPMGVEAARRMGGGKDAASDALCLFLVINASSVQLVPSSVIALRAAEGSAAPGAVTGPALIATLISTVVGIAACKMAERFSWA